MLAEPNDGRGALARALLGQGPPHLLACGAGAQGQGGRHRLAVCVGEQGGGRSVTATVREKVSQLAKVEAHGALASLCRALRMYFPLPNTMH